MLQILQIILYIIIAFIRNDLIKFLTMRNNIYIIYLRLRIHCSIMYERNCRQDGSFDHFCEA